ncbi:UbiA family prenyltransferase [Flaviaesturariibacter flavus]|uniref:UbiA family prenyltransferase n=1 Tax=Flaviaesturariibacter flavus TaxID=2502780 RepID=UPI001404D1A9|nr:UbiA family prenyltransferase [Flaviaesturariibacter flavus]
MLHRSTIQLLRFPFSLFLLPVYLFAISQVPEVDRGRAALIFFILHVLVYPASNGYNSYMDRDETPIGGLRAPLQPTRQLFWTTVLLDGIAILLSLLFVNAVFAFGVLAYIAASRAYSWRGLRLKRFPVTGFLTVFLFQGAWIYAAVALAFHAGGGSLLLPALAASCLVGALYPLTQIYQFEADRADGVTTISYKLGKRGSFLFSMFLFAAAAALLFCYFSAAGQLNHFYRFLVITLPVVGFFFYWMRKVWRNEAAADFRHSLQMNLVATACTTLYFLTLIYSNH